MSSNKKALFLLILLIVPLVFAQDFSLYEDTQPGNLCPGTTGLFTDVILNSGNEPISITTSSSGSASTFSTTVPQGITLLPQQSKTIYTYVTPRSSTTPGTYSLNLITSSNGQSQELSHNVAIKDCYEFSLETINPQKNICPCESDKFEFRLTNNGEYTESYSLEVEGEYSSSTVLSTDSLTLTPGQSEIIFVYTTTSCNDLGDYDFTLKATSLSTSTMQTATSTQVVDACYDFSVQTERDLVNICEHTQETIPITVQNTGSTSNRFNLNLDGPAWANIDKNSVNIAPNSQELITLILNPDYGVEGSFELEFTATPERGEVSALNLFNVNINKCHGVTVNIEKSEDSICNSLENTYNVNVRNAGQFQKDYYLNIDGPAWATLDKTSADLNVGQEEQVTLTINPPFNTPEATYLIEVQAIAKDSTKIANSDKIEIKAISRDKCYQAFLGIEEKKIDVFYDSSATIPIVVENKGTYSTTYELSLSGTASNFVYLNPSTITVDPGKSELVYLYIAPSGQIANGDYSITVSTRLGDSGVLASEKIDIKVSESGAPSEEQQDSTERVSFLNKIIGFFKSMFTSEDKIEEDIFEEEEIIEDTGDLDELEEDFDDIEEEIIEEPQDEFFSISTTLGQGESEEFILGEETHTIEVTGAEGNVILITISSDPILFALEEGDSQKVDIDGDGMYDLEVTFIGYLENGKADLVYSQIEEPVPVEIPSEDTQEEEPLDETQDESASEETSGEPFFASFLTSLTALFSGAIASIGRLRYHIIGVIIIILVIYFIFKSGFSKKITEFFEEEIEEEPIPPSLDEKVEKEDTKEKPEPKEKKLEEKKKKEPKKKTKKEEVNEDTEDEIEIKGLEEEKESEEEDFIIEFDDDEEEKK